MIFFFDLLRLMFLGLLEIDQRDDTTSDSPLHFCHYLNLVLEGEEDSAL